MSETNNTNNKMGIKIKMLYSKGLNLTTLYPLAELI